MVLLIVYPDVSVPSCVDSVLARRGAGPGALCAALGARGGRGRRAGGGRGGAGGLRTCNCKGPVDGPGLCVLVDDTTPARPDGVMYGAPG